jgi:hypothetical protein
LSTNRDRITYHNQLIDQAQEKVSALPDAATGAQVDVCAVTIDTGMSASFDYIYVTVLDEGVVKLIDISKQVVSGAVELQNVVVNTIICVYGAYMGNECYGGIEEAYGYGDIFLVKGDGRLELHGVV